MLLLESDPIRRAALKAALARAGFPVVAVDSIGAVEHWPDGEIVVTESSRFTPWWQQVGATHVIVLADTPEDGERARAGGATHWVQRTCTPARLVAVVQSCHAGVRTDRRRAVEDDRRAGAWLFTRADDSVWFEVRPAADGMELVVRGPGSIGASHQFPTHASLTAFQRAYQQRLIAEGFSMHPVVERRT